MNKLITLSFIPKLYKEWLLSIVITLIGAEFLYKIMHLNSRWTLYLLVGPVGLWGVFVFYNPLIQMVVLMFILIFLEGILIDRRYLLQPVIPFLGIGISLIFAVTVFFSFLYHRQRARSLGSFKPLWILFLLTAVISMIIGSSEDPESLIGNISYFQCYHIEFFLFFYLGFLAFTNAKDINKFFFIMVVFGGLVALGHFYSIKTGSNIELIRGAEVVHESRNLAAGKWRYGSFFESPNMMALFYVMMIPVSLVLMFSKESLFKRIVTGGSMVAMLFSLFIGASRGGALFALLNSVFALFFLKINRKMILSVLLFLVVIYFISGFLQQYFMDSLERTTERFTTKGLSDLGRSTAWYWAPHMIITHPFGIGLYHKNYTKLLLQYANIYLRHSHNLFIQVALNNGIIGLVVFLTIVARTMGRNLKAYLNTTDLNSALALACILLSLSGFLLFGLVEALTECKVWYIFGIILGISVSFNYQVLGEGRKERHASFKRRRSEAVIQNQK